MPNNPLQRIAAMTRLPLRGNVRPKAITAMEAPSINPRSHIARFNVQHVAVATLKRFKRLKRSLNSEPVVTCLMYSTPGTNTKSVAISRHCSSSKRSKVGLHFSTAIYLGSLRAKHSEPNNRLKERRAKVCARFSQNVRRPRHETKNCICSCWLLASWAGIYVFHCPCPMASQFRTRWRHILQLQVPTDDLLGCAWHDGSHGVGWSYWPLLPREASTGRSARP